MSRMKCNRCGHVNPSGARECTLCKSPLPRIRIEMDSEPAPPPASAPVHVSQFRHGDTLAGRYTFLQIIGRGGMGCIYRVRDNVLGEEVALKTLLPQFGQDKVVLERFFNEAKIARRLAHPNIVRVHDIGVADNVVYISMELLSGRSLRDTLEALPPNVRLPWTETVRIAMELCSALEFAHRFTVHRDIKPENIMVLADGTVKLMDFGISKLMIGSNLTGASMVMGTPMYMPPEQLRNSRDVDARADLFSVGVLLYECLTGTVPSGVPKRVTELAPEVPAELELIVNKCVEPNREQRYSNAAELRQALLNVGRAGTPGPSHATRARKPLPVRAALGWLAAAGIAAATAAGVYTAENRRMALLESSATIAPVSNSANGDLQAFESLVPRLRDRAATLPMSDAAHAQAVTLGAQYWSQAQAGGPDAAVRAREAAQCYAAAIAWPEGMAFVPPGEITFNGIVTPVPPFFIDVDEVGMESYRKFTVDAGWRVLPGTFPEDPAADEPMANVRFYDAQAYAAHHGCLLPTEAQWARAAFGEAPSAATPDETWVHCRDMRGGLSEWTRTPASGSAETPVQFGLEMVVRGGNYEWTPADPLQDRANALFGQPTIVEFSSPLLGFRCVMELPATPAGLEALLKS